eukprot:scaffold1035_cov184-Skeletonema_dohrnii-CCMP3373.AAC.1
MAAVSNRASPGHLRRCSEADTPKTCLSRDEDASLLSWPTVLVLAYNMTSSWSWIISVLASDVWEQGVGHLPLPGISFYESRSRLGCTLRI